MAFTFWVVLAAVCLLIVWTRPTTKSTAVAAFVCTWVLLFVSLTVKP